MTDREVLEIRSGRTYRIVVPGPAVVVSDGVVDYSVPPHDDLTRLLIAAMATPADQAVLGGLYDLLSELVRGTPPRPDPDEWAAKVVVAISSDHGDSDPETTHKATDWLMQELLTHLGYGEGVKLIENSHRWYS